MIEEGHADEAREIGIKRYGDVGSDSSVILA
jgi:hypothetical protein